MTCHELHPEEQSCYSDQFSGAIGNQPDGVIQFAALSDFHVSMDVGMSSAGDRAATSRGTNSGKSQLYYFRRPISFRNCKLYFLDSSMSGNQANFSSVLCS